MILSKFYIMLRCIIMCGICCFIGYYNGFKLVFNGLKLLLNRGYDSCGCAGILDNKESNRDNKESNRDNKESNRDNKESNRDNKESNRDNKESNRDNKESNRDNKESNRDNKESNRELIVHKYANRVDKDSIDLLEADMNNFENCKLIISHTRWLTTGSKTDANAHPHIDYKNRIALVHNGIIENYTELKAELEKNYNIEFRSQTDTEVIVNLISVYYDKNKNMEEAIVEATQMLQGTWAIAVISIDKADHLYCARHGSPLLIGFGSNFMMLASEQTGFAEYVNDYICLNDGDVIVLKKEDGRVNFEKKYLYEMKNITIKDIVLTPYPFLHWTIKEIKEQIESSSRSINFGARLLDDDKVKLGGLEEHKDRLSNIEHLILLGCGTSYHAALRGAIFFKDLCNFTTVQAFDAGEFNERDIPKQNVTGNIAVILLSQSGETKDVHRCIPIASRYNLFTIGIVNVVDSLIAREVNCGCYLNAGREVAVASTKSFTSQIIVLSLIAIWFAQNTNINNYRRMEYINCLRNLPHDIKKTIRDVEDKCKEVAMFLKDKHSCFILGKGEMEPYAKEGALKIKEIGYIHAEGYSALALKHGPFSLLQDNTPVFILHPSSNDDDYVRVSCTIDEVISRDAPLVLITDKKSKLNHEYVITVPQNSTFKGILHLIPMQLIAYYLSLYKGNNPDMPRNLAKTVTVF